MTERKSFKRRVRARMDKTGERYTAARRRLVEAEQQADEEAAPAEAAAEERISDEVVSARTGRTRAEWFALLDDRGALDRPHAEVARYLREEHGVAGWWAQHVTVAYERARGLRARHERSDGFSVGASRTVAVPAERLFAAFVEDEERARSLPPGSLRLRTAQPGRTARFDWEDGRASTSTSPGRARRRAPSRSSTTASGTPARRSGRKRSGGSGSAS